MLANRGDLADSGDLRSNPRSRKERSHANGIGHSPIDCIIDNSGIGTTVIDIAQCEFKLTGRQNGRVYAKMGTNSLFCLCKKRGFGELMKVRCSSY